VTNPERLTAVVLAAGQGTRMVSTTPKVLHTMCGRTLLGHVLAAVEAAGATEVVVVVGAGHEAVSAHLAEIAPTARPVVQEQQLGTGHATRVALSAVRPADGAVLVVPGDAPLLGPDSLRELTELRRRTGAAAALLTADLAEPAGYGRVVRRSDGSLQEVVEDRDADPATRAVTEVATSVYAFRADRLVATLPALSPDNVQGEEYLTDVIGLLTRAGDRVEALLLGDAGEALGVNDRVQLAQARRAMRDRLIDRWMRAGVTVTDPQTTWLGVGVQLEPDVTIHQNTQLHGSTRIERGAVVGPNCTLTDTRVRAGAVVRSATCEGAEIGEGAQVGPYTYLRPGTRIGTGGKAGTFVEVKESTIGAGSKVPHLSYVGDATIGERSNVGAGTVFVNYDGIAKHHTSVGDDVRIGSDTMLVAPRVIGDGSYTAAGSVITEDVPPGAMAVARARQRNVEGWVARKRAGTRSAEAAERALRGGLAENVPDKAPAGEDGGRAPRDQGEGG
jgi:bifunctional UDP-N-acetylglucosamine pyrophosphorylase/glucosamine-1-phosphate N-acetyltransferase